MKPIFNSIGSNYSASFLRACLKKADKRAPKKLEAYLKARYGAADVQLTSKGREAISCLLMSLDLPPGSLVAMNGYTCYAAYDAVRAVGHVPLLLDIERDSVNFTAERLSQSIKENHSLRVVMVQNTFGQVADIKAIEAICNHNGLLLIEDIALSAGCYYLDGREVGTVGVGAALSFSQDKMVDGVSGGAAILKEGYGFELLGSGHEKEHSSRFALRSNNIPARIYPFATWLVRKTHRLLVGKVLMFVMKAIHLWMMPMSGGRSAVRRLPAWNAGLALRAFEDLESTMAHRRAMTKIYHESLPSSVQLSWQPEMAYLRFPILVGQPEELVKYLIGIGLYTGNRWFNAPVGQAQYMHLSDYQPGQCPNAEYVADHILNLPTHINVSEKQARLISERVNKWLRSK